LETLLGVQKASRFPSKLDIAKELFLNLNGLPDGSVVYGILINQLGLPHSDQEYLGNKHAESRNVLIENVKVKGLYATPIEVPHLQTNDGTRVQVLFTV
jgi:hypothetical protein